MKNLIDDLKDFKEDKILNYGESNIKEAASLIKKGDDSIKNGYNFIFGAERAMESIHRLFRRLPEDNTPRLINIPILRSLIYSKFKSNKSERNEIRKGLLENINALKTLKDVYNERYDLINIIVDINKKSILVLNLLVENIDVSLEYIYLCNYDCEINPRHISIEKKFNAKKKRLLEAVDHLKKSQDQLFIFKSSLEKCSEKINEYGYWFDREYNS